MFKLFKILQPIYKMKSRLISILPIIIRLLLNQLQACQSSNPRGWYLKVKKSEYEALKQKQESQSKELKQAQNFLKKGNRIQHQWLKRKRKFSRWWRIRKSQRDQETDINISQLRKMTRQQKQVDQSISLSTHVRLIGWIVNLNWSTLRPEHRKGAVSPGE